MSKIALEGNASGTGTLTIASQNTNSNYTLTLPNSTGTLVVTGGAQTIEFAAGTAAAPSITFTGDTNTGIFSPGADTIAFSEGGAESMRITSAGDVGVGTTSPNLGGVNKAITLNSAASTNASYELSINGTFIGSMYTNTADSSLRFGGWQNAPMVFLTNSTERMRIDSSGNVGIGTSSVTSSRVQIKGANNTTTAYADGLKVTSNNETVICNYSWTGIDANDSLRLATAGTERARISSGGTFFINNSTAINSEILNVRQSSSANLTGIAVGYGSSGGQWRSMSITSSNIMTFNNGLNEGTLSSAGAWTNASDARLKTNIREIEYGLNTVLVAKPRHFERVDVDGTYIGFVAQELQTVVPEVVSGDPETQYGVDYGSLVAVAFKAIQELKTITDAQATRIEALEAEVAALKGQ